MVILVPVDAAQLDSLCQYFMGMTVWNGSVPLSTWISALILRNTSKYITAVSPLEGSVLTMTPFILTKINLSFADFNWLTLKITFQLWCLVHFSLNVILKHSNFYMSLASSFYFSTKPNCSNRNACKIPASAFQRHVGTVVFLADMTTCPETRSWQWWKTLWVSRLAQGKIRSTQSCSWTESNLWSWQQLRFVPHFRVFPCWKTLQVQSIKLPQHKSPWKTFRPSHQSQRFLRLFLTSRDSLGSALNTCVLPHLTLCTERLLPEEQLPELVQRAKITFLPSTAQMELHFQLNSGNGDLKFPWKHYNSTVLKVIEHSVLKRLNHFALIVFDGQVKDFWLAVWSCYRCMIWYEHDAEHQVDKLWKQNPCDCGTVSVPLCKGCSWFNESPGYAQFSQTAESKWQMVFSPPKTFWLIMFSYTKA